MADVISVVTTPLALAALAILALVGFRQAAATKRGGSIDARSFWLILLFGLVGSVSYIFIYISDNFLFADAVLRGELRTENGRPIKHATIDLANVGVTATSESGSFEISIPYSRQHPDYKLFTFVNGLPGKETIIKGPRPAPLSMRFSTSAELSQYISVHDISYLSQNIGDPLITVGFRVKNNISGRVKLALYQVVLNKPDGSSLSFFPVLTHRNGQMTPSGHIIVDEDNRGAEYSIMSSPEPNRVFQLGQQIAVAEGMSWLADCMQWGANKDVENRIISFFDSVFTWDEGIYKFTARFRIEDTEKSVDFEFSLNKSESSRLKNMRSRSMKCNGMAFDLSQIPALAFDDGSATNTMLRNLKRM